MRHVFFIQKDVCIQQVLAQNNDNFQFSCPHFDGMVLNSVNMSTISLVLLISLLFGFVSSSDTRTGFWYGDSRPPHVQYDTVPYANLTVKINRPFQAGPGDYLVKDPFTDGSASSYLFAGNTINRQTFDTQFILDLSYAVGIDVDRVYVIHVTKGTVHYSWESENVIVNFIILERNELTGGATLLDAIASLTNQIQANNSLLYVDTNVTNSIDSTWGLEVNTWDISLKLTYAIDVIGGDQVLEGYYLNQGSLGICNDPGASVVAKYCEFERFFEDDVSRALGIKYYRVQVLFVKVAALDSVLVHFRVMPPMRNETESDVTYAVADLTRQVSDSGSLLYSGNVTIRTGRSNINVCNSPLKNNAW